MDDVRPASSGGSAPASLWSISLLAVLPFLISAGVYAYGPRESAHEALIALLSWSAVVLAFLGGVRWGLETMLRQPRPMRLLGSAVLPAVAWALFLGRAAAPEALILAGFLIAFLLQWLFDHRARGAPGRYPRLSTVLTGGACVSLALALEQALHA